MKAELFSSEQLSRARSLFPFLKTGRVYLNHAATSPLSTRVVEAMQRHLMERSEGTVDTYVADMTIIDRLRAKIATMINAESPTRIAFALNTTDALNVVATGIRWQSGDRIILNDAEFPANVYPYLSSQSKGVEVDILSAPDGKVTPEEIEQRLTSRTRVVALSAVQFLSGYRADLAAIGALCRQREVLFIVDAIQAVGAIPIDVQAMKIDAMSAGAQKWQMGPHGTGFLYVTEQLQNQLQQQYVGWLGVQEPWDFFNYHQPLHTSAKRYEGGTLNISGLWGMDAAISTLLEVGIDKIERHLLALTDLLINRLVTLDGCELVTPHDDAHRAGIVTVRPTGIRDAKSIFRTLEARNINISLREGVLRFSPHFYNSSEEIERTANAITEIMNS